MPDLPARLRSALAGRYDIERAIGEGAMATVYLARDLKHSRPVGVKVLGPELSAVLGTERFHQEIAFTARFVSGPFANVAGYSYDVSPDGERLLLIQGPSGESANHIRVIRDFITEIKRAEARR